MGLCISACRKNATSSNAETVIKEEKSEPIDFDFDQIKERGSLIAVVDNSSTGYFIYRGQPMGYEYDLLKRLADDLDVSLKIRLTADIEQAFDMLNSGEADLMAYHLTVTRERAKRVAFTKAHTQVRQVLVQRKPKNWRKLKVHELEDAMLRSTLDLVGKEVYTRKGSSYSERLANLSEEIGGDIIILEQPGQTDTESLIRKVANGEIDYTVADEDVGLINATYYPNIDVKTPISFPQTIAWAVRKNAPQLRTTVDDWLTNMKASPDFNVIYNRYFKYRKSQNLRAHSIYSSAGGLRISPYDDLIKEGAKSLSLDWMLLASLIYQESKFDPEAKSWAGAKGLMQLTDVSIEQYDVDEPFDPEDNMEGGTEFLSWLEDLWSDKVPDENERMKFVLASYNVGQGHVLDAVRLAKKYGKDPEVWDDNVAHFLLQKTKPEFYNDPVVKYGYCRGNEPVNYVDEILERYERYETAYENRTSASDSTLVTDR
ncbi:MAG: transporter substrate-binding domain-containing protein [Roseivirga sp.]